MRVSALFDDLVRRASRLPFPWSKRGREDKRPWEGGCLFEEFSNKLSHRLLDSSKLWPRKVVKL